MTAPTHVLAIDQGTTSSRAIVFRADFSIAGMAQAEFPQHYPRSGWVEHDPEDIWRTVLATCRQALANAGVGARDLAALGITNQRETTILWDRETGQPIYPAIVWQDRRTAEACAALEAAGHDAAVTATTGLRFDPYFSATKIAWVLDHVTGARARAEQGKLAFGTVDSFLLWRLTGGALHATDITNASRTLLFDIHAKAWSRPLLDLFRIPDSVLPDVRDNDAEFGATIAAHLGAAVPITGMAGDQQAALIGQACFAPGMMKSTYGTGCFAVLNTGAEPVVSRNRLLTTIGYSIGGRTTYALEGSIFVAGAAVQWLRDGLGIISSAGETAAMAEAADPDQDVILVPAFVGLGAPYWDAEARGALFGLTRATGPNELARAALESVCFQTADLLDAMHRDIAHRDVGHSDAGGGGAGATDTVLRVDGGLAASEWTMQRLADLTGATVDRPAVLETTALGAAYLAGCKAGIYPPPERFAELWARDRRFLPAITAAQRDKRLAAWRAAVARTLSDHAGR